MHPNKIPFDKKIAIHVLTTIDLMIELSKEFNDKLTTKQLQEIKEKMKNKYYNENVELLEID